MMNMKYYSSALSYNEDSWELGNSYGWIQGGISKLISLDISPFHQIDQHYARKSSIDKKVCIDFSLVGDTYAY
jgi:hypothetical protein